MNGPLGRRGAVLLIIGVLWVLQGVGVYLAPVNPAIPESDWLLYERLPVAVRVTAWKLTGIVAVAAAYLRTRGRSDRWGFLALVVMPVERAASFLWAFLLWLNPWWDGGAPRALVGATVWTGVAAVIIIVSGWREAPPSIAEVLTRPTSHDDGDPQPGATA